MRSLSRRLAGCLALALALALAGAAYAEPSAPARSAPDPTADRDLTAAGFFESHPDLKFRTLGARAYRDGDHDQAAVYFDRAARFADKPSQAMLAEMRWEGIGVPKDRALAYAWMDLAAERGYAELIGMREHYWTQLDTAERERALQVGATVYARYGDAVAKPRIDAQLRRDRRKVVGSRTGFAGNAKLYIATPGASEAPTVSADGGKQGAYPVTVIDGTRYYAPDYWAPERYHAWQERQWRQHLQGEVQVGEVKDISRDAGDKVPAPAPPEPGPLRR